MTAPVNVWQPSNPGSGYALSGANAGEAVQTLFEPAERALRESPKAPENSVVSMAAARQEVLEA